MGKIDWLPTKETDFEKIKRWIFVHGYNLRQGDEFMVVYDDREITWSRIDTDFSNLEPRALKDEEINILLLHECGHVLSSLEDEVLLDPQSKDDFYFNILTDEIRAWDKARKIAQRLNIKFSKEAWLNVRNAALRNYAVWATERGQIEDWMLGAEFVLAKKRKKKKK